MAWIITVLGIYRKFYFHQQFALIEQYYLAVTRLSPLSSAFSINFSINFWHFSVNFSINFSITFGTVIFRMNTSVRKDGTTYVALSESKRL